MATANKLKPMEEAREDSRAAKGGDVHEAALTMEQFVLLNSLSADAGRTERAMVVMAELLMDERTIESVRRYQDVFEAADVNVSDALEAVPRSLALRTLIQKLEVALEIARRNHADSVEPIARTASEVRRFVEGTPKHSRIRAAFATMDERWEETFTGGRKKAPEVEVPKREDPPKPA